MKLINAWCPLPIRKICNSIFKVLGIHKKTKAYQGVHQFQEQQAQTKPMSTSKQKTTNILTMNTDSSSKQQTKINEKTGVTDIKNQEKQQPQKLMEINKQSHLFESIEKNILLPEELSSGWDNSEKQQQDRSLLRNQEIQQKNNNLLSNPPITNITIINDNIIDEIQIPKKSKKQQIKIQIPTQLIDTNSFKINLDPYQKYYQILQQKSKNLKQKFNLSGTLIQLQKTNSQLQIRHTQSDKINIFFYTFKLPCTYNFYNSMLNDYSLQKRIDPNIDQYKMLQLITNNARINYLSYKKVLIVSPRDFVYMKYSNNWENEYWDISFSVPFDVTPNRIRGEIILSACKIIQRGEQILVNVYSQVDMKLSVSPKITKNQAVNEIKKYVQKCDKYIRQNYRRQIA